MQNTDAEQSTEPVQNQDAARSAAPGEVRRPRIGIPVRLSSSADPDPRVAKANTLFGCIVSLIRDVGGEPVLLTPESVQGAVAGSGAAHSLTADGGPSGRVAAPGAPTSGTPDGGAPDWLRRPTRPRRLTASYFPAAERYPRIYGEEPGPALYDVNTEQDRLDFAVARRALDAGMPALGICRGHQLLNVLYGGTLVQDMTPGTVPHRQIPAAASRPWVCTQACTITPGSKVAKMYAGVDNPEGGGTSSAAGGDAATGGVGGHG